MWGVLGRCKDAFQKQGRDPAKETGDSFDAFPGGRDVLYRDVFVCIHKVSDDVVAMNAKTGYFVLEDAKNQLKTRLYLRFFAVMT
jgi:hypothetical protein